MRWHDKEINNPKVFDSKDLSEDTQRIRTDVIRNKLEEETQKEKYKEEYLAYKNFLRKQKKKRTKILIALFIVLVLIGTSTTFVMIKKYSHIGDLENEAERLINLKQYNKAGKVYKELYEETDNLQYIQKYKFISSIVNNKKMIKEAKQNIRDKEYENAINILLTIHTDDSIEVEKINQLISEASMQWLDSIRDMYRNGEVSYAKNEINKYNNILPDNAAGIDLKNIIFKRNVITNEQEYKNNRERNFLGTQNNNEVKRMYELARTIIGTKQQVSMDNTSIKIKPEANSKDLVKLRKNDIVYVQDIFVSGTDSVWCKVFYENKGKSIVGWIPYNNLYINNTSSKM